MKHIKDLGVITQEGIEIKELKRFPSMEWGDEGGLQAAIFLDGEFMGTLFQAGEGGCANFSCPSAVAYQKIAEAGCAFLKRVDKAYGPNTQYSWLKNKTVKNMNDDDFEAVVTNIEEEAEIRTQVRKALIQGYKSVVVIEQETQFSYLYYQCEGVTSREVEDFLKRKKVQYTDFKIYTSHILNTRF